MEDIFCFKIGGPAGFGIMSAGATFSKICTRSGYEVFDYTEYPSIVRGGHNVMQVSVSKEPVFAPVQHTDFLVALNKETVDLHKDELVSGSVVLYNSAQEIDESGLPEEVKACGMPFVKIAKDLGGLEVMRNTVAMGATVALLGGELKHLMDLIAEEFSDKKQEIIDVNQKVAQAGYDYALENFNDSIRQVLKPVEKNPSEKKMVITANEAVAMGAIAGGMQMAVIYPMTPISNILHTLAPLQEKYGFVYKQPEDEISGINMALGASWAGARSMVATSGGGFCLMTEAYGLAGLTETPLVIIEGMRGAPATGLPTWTEQGDLRMVLHSHQGDFPRIVLAAGDAEEAFHLTMQAFNLAEKYQTPVVVIVDKMICESHQSWLPFTQPQFEGDFNFKDYQIDRGKLTMEKVENYQRYALSDDGISLRSIPGVGNHVMANSDEHNAEGYSNEEAENRNQQMRKRMKKLEICAEKDMVDLPMLYGPEDAEVTIVSWGSNKGSILQAMRILNQESGIRNNELGGVVNYVHNTWMNPFPVQGMRERMSKAKYLINVECNFSAQYGGLIKQKTGVDILDNLLKYDGRPIYPEEIVEKVKSVIN